MSTGEILDRTFSNYRHNFKLFAGIAAIPSAILLILKLIIVLVQTVNAWTPTASRAVGSAALTFGIVSSVVAFILYLVCLAISEGATAYAVSGVHLEIPTTIRESYGRIKGRYGRMVNVILSIYIRVFGVIIISYLLLIGIAFIPGTMGITGTMLTIVVGILALVGFFGGIVWGIRLFAQYSLAVPACVIEDINARASLKRSVFLSKGSLGKILAIYVLVVILKIVATFAVALPIGMLLVVSKSTVWATTVTVLQEIGGFVVGSVVGPLATIALSLVYFDERVRKEAFDIQYMMTLLPETGPQPETDPTVQPGPSAAVGSSEAASTSAEEFPHSEGAGTANG